MKYLISLKNRLLKKPKYFDEFRDKLKKLGTNTSNSSWEMSMAERVLGDKQKAAEIHSYFKENSESMSLIALNGLMEFAESSDFTPEQRDAYKKGLMYFYNFYKKTYTELESKKKIMNHGDLDPRKMSHSGHKDN